DKEDNARLVELIRALEEDKEAQWWIEDVAQTPGNKPAQLMLVKHVHPIVSDLIIAVTALIEVEKSLQNGTERKDVQWLMVDLQQFFIRAEVILNDFVHTGSSTQVENFRINLYGAKQQLQELEIRLKQLNPEQRELLTFILNEVTIFESYSSKVIDIRQSTEWDVARNLLLTEAIPRARIAYTLARTFSVNQIKRMQVEAGFITTASNIAISLLFGLIVTMVLVAWFVSKRGAERITQPISALSLATRKLAEGLLVTDITVTSDDELGHLTQSFNVMRTSLQQSRNDLNRQNTELEQEITERKRMEKALHKTYEQLEIRVQERTVELAEANQALQAEMNEHMQAEEMFQLVVEGSPNAIVLVNQAGEIVLVNSQTEKFFGYEREQLIGQPLEILVPERFRSKHFKYYNDFFKDPQSRKMGIGQDLYALRKNGSEFPVEIGLNPIKQADVTLVLSLIVDITERKQAEEKLQTLSSAIEQSPNAVLITNVKG
ncbi:MAG: PAS domain S-box protein, partial [Methylococcales bacterium]|nr:PAS domain S-box protein [Methylococcales bacterium]